MKFQLTKRKKIFILVGMFALLAVTGYLNFALNKGGSPVGGGTQSSATFFTTFHAQRADERAASIAILSSMAAEDSAYSAEARANAAAQLMALLANIHYENTVEGLIRAKDFEDAIVMKTNDNINVVVKGDLNKEQQEDCMPSIFGIILEQFNAGEFGEFDIEKVFVSFMA